jgi:hypothetical protein
MEYRKDLFGNEVKPGAYCIVTSGNAVCFGICHKYSASGNPILMMSYYRDAESPYKWSRILTNCWQISSGKNENRVIVLEEIPKQFASVFKDLEDYMVKRNLIDINDLKRRSIQPTKELSKV